MTYGNEAGEPALSTAAESETTLLLQRWRDNDPDAMEQLVPLVYRELRRMARAELSRHEGHQTLQPTALVNDLFMRLLDCDALLKVDSRQHFFSLSARMMRQILIARARAGGAEKRGGDWLREEFSDVLALPLEEDARLIELDEALRRLETLQPRMAQVVELRCFGGHGVAEVAALLGMDERTVYRDWAAARAWLLRALDGGD